MIKIGITGQAGFIGTHLANTINLDKDRFRLIPFEDGFFSSAGVMDGFVSQCDVIVHLAAMNRHSDPDIIYQTNLDLVQKLIDAMERTGSRPYVLMSSSLQEERDNLYGRSKKEGRLLLAAWAQRNGARFTGLIIPNVFGPFGVPFYNSVISTFCHQLANGSEPVIEQDASLKLIYINDLIALIIHLVSQQDGPALNSSELKVNHMAERKVSDLLVQLRSYKSLYQDSAIIPDLSDPFDLALFNTFRSHLPLKDTPVYYKKHTDDRGDFVEVMKFNSCGQVSYSTTKPGITRGNHFHIRKMERFAVIRGRAAIHLRRYGTDQVYEYIIEDGQPAFVDMPVWFSHNITNIGTDELVTLFWINEQYDPTDPDTYFEPVQS